jgi:hypothetical protein
MAQLNIARSRRRPLALSCWRIAQMCFGFSGAFPSWLPSLNAAAPAAVERVILQEIAWELGNGSPESGSLYVLYDVAWSGQWIWNQLAQPFVRMLSPVPKNTENLRYMMDVIQGSDYPDLDLAKLAAKKVGAARQPASAPAWFAVWSGVDGARHALEEGGDRGQGEAAGRRQGAPRAGGRDRGRRVEALDEEVGASHGGGRGRPEKVGNLQSFLLTRNMQTPTLSG